MKVKMHLYRCPVGGSGRFWRKKGHEFIFALSHNQPPPPTVPCEGHETDAEFVRTLSMPELAKLR